jgi:DNA-binding Xre family transcriptional regulator
MSLHIGKLIQQQAKESKIGPTEFGNKLNTTSQNIYAIYKRKSIDTDLLMKICIVLNYNFFIELAKDKQLAGFKPNDAIQAEARLSSVEQYNKILSEKIELLNELVNQQKKHILLLEKKHTKDK